MNDSKYIAICLMALGKAQEKTGKILDDDIFQDLSKYDPYWDSDHEKEAEKLDDIRRKLSFFRDSLYDVYEIIHPIEEE